MRRSAIMTVSLISAVAFLAPMLQAQGPAPREPGRFPTDVIQASQPSTQLAQSSSPQSGRSSEGDSRRGGVGSNPVGCRGSRPPGRLPVPGS